MATPSPTQSPFASRPATQSTTRPAAAHGKPAGAIKAVIGALLALATLGVSGLGGGLYMLAGSAPQQCSIAGATAATLIACYLLARAGEMIASAGE